MAPFLLQWGAVLKAKERGMKWYDFWGIDEKKWSGVTRFKKRFGGKEVSYPPASDLVLSKFWYKIYKTSKALKY
jgi:lipid II:glycine glycyltransferase (peptidoglycan interpeptide bridge formation enzyme)